MACLHGLGIKNQIFTNNITPEEFEAHLEKYSKRGWIKSARDSTTSKKSKKDKTQLNPSLELPPIKKGDLAACVSCTIPIAVRYGDIEQKERTRSPSHSQKELPKNSIRQLKPCPPGSVVPKKKKKDQDSKASFICQGTNLKEQASLVSSEKPEQYDSGSKQHKTTSAGSKELNYDTSKLPGTHTLNGPVFSPWLGRKKTKPHHTESMCENQSLYKCSDWKKNRCFDLKAMLKDLIEIQQYRKNYGLSVLPFVQSYNNVKQITIDTAAAYATRVRAERKITSKGGGYRDTLSPSVKDEVQMKTLMRQSLSSFYDLGGSLNYAERVIIDACHKKHSRLKLKYLTGLPPDELTTCPLAIPFATAPFVPISNIELRKIYKILEQFPWYSWYLPFEFESKDTIFDGKAVGKKVELVSRLEYPSPTENTTLENMYDTLKGSQYLSH